MLWVWGARIEESRKRRKFNKDHQQQTTKSTRKTKSGTYLGLSSSLPPDTALALHFLVVALNPFG
jgi:hypothetical protein